MTQAKDIRYDINQTIEYARWILIWFQKEQLGTFTDTYTTNIVEQYNKKGYLSQAQCAGIHNIYKGYQIQKWRNEQKKKLPLSEKKFRIITPQEMRLRRLLPIHLLFQKNNDLIIWFRNCEKCHTEMMDCFKQLFETYPYLRV